MKTNIFKLLITTTSEKMLSYSANQGENYIQRQHLDLIRHTTPEYSSTNTISFEKIGGDYSYLLNMPIWSLTKERYEDLMNKAKSKKEQLDNTINLVPKEMYLEDLNELKKKL